MSYVVAALYQFAPIQDLSALRQELLTLCKAHKICGSLLIAHEGINGTIAGSRAGIDAVKKALAKKFTHMEYKESSAEVAPFHRMKVRLKKEIVTIGLPEIDPNIESGTYLDPEEWNKLLADPDTLVLDTRNDYEVKIGTFKNAVDPHTKTFREFPDYVEKNLGNQKKRKVAMFCTGGIRCEKASSYMKHAGFDDVYHLKGGILKYLETIPADKSLWEGECFVFDQRVSVGHGLKQGDYVLCPSCRHPVSAEGRKHPSYEEGVCCSNCAATLTPEKRAAAAERQKQMKLAEARGEKHIGAQYVNEGE